MEQNLAKLLVPEEILAHYEFDGYKEEQGVYRIYLTEKSDVDHIPKEIVRVSKAVLDGYLNPVELQTFPLNGQEVFLYLRRRRWKLKGETKGYSNTYDFHERGMKATRAFGTFLKEIGRG